MQGLFNSAKHAVASVTSPREEEEITPRKRTASTVPALRPVRLGSTVPVQLDSPKRIESQHARLFREKGKGVVMGWLYKDNKKGLLSSRQPYVKRFFVFDTTNMSLSYYKDENAAMAKTELDKGKFRLKDVQSFTIPSSDAKATEYGTDSIDIRVDDRDFTFINGPDLPNVETSERLMMLIKKRISKKDAGIQKPETEEHMKEMYSEVLEALAIPEAKRAEMMQVDVDKMWQLILINQSMLHDDDASDASDWAEMLKEEPHYPSRVDARRLTAVIRTSPKKWMSTFFRDGGFAEIMRMMSTLCMVDEIKSNELEVLMEFLACLKALMNNKQGLDNIIATENAINIIATPIRLGIIEVNLLVLEMLSVFCWYSTEAHASTIKAMNDFQLVNREPVRFATLLHGMGTVPNQDLKLACLTFINTIVNSSGKLEERLLLRGDFLCLNLMGICQKVIVNIKEESLSTAEFKKQVEVFEKFMVSDSQDSVFNDQPLSDPGSLFEIILKSVQESGNTANLINILQKAATIPTDQVLGSGMWDLIVKHVDKITTLNTSKDILGSNVNVNYDELKRLLLQKETLSDAASTIKAHEGTIKRMRVKIEELEKNAAAYNPSEIQKKIDEALKIQQVRQQKEMESLEEDLAKANKTIFDMKADSHREKKSSVDSGAGNIVELEALRAQVESLTAQLKSSAAGGSIVSAPVVSAPVVVVVDEKYIKFEKMQKMNVPEGAIRVKMAAEKFTPSEIDFFFNGSYKTTSIPTPVVSAPVIVVVDEKYIKFEKMQKMNVPEGAIRVKMAGENFTPSEIDSFFNGSYKTAGSSSSPPPPPPAPVMDEKYVKYDKMRKMLPEGAVRQKMMTDGFSPSEIDGFFNMANASSVPPPPPSTSTSVGPPVPTTRPVSKAVSPPPPPVPTGPVKTKRKTRVKMRDFFWSQLPDNKIEGTTWSELNDEKMVLDLNELDKLYEQKEDAKEEKTNSGGEKKEVEKIKEINLITDGNRQRNVNISLSRLRMPFDDLKNAIYAVDEIVLHVDLVQTLMNMIPTQEEIEIVQSYDGKIELLANVDRFMLSVADIPKLNNRMKCLSFKLNYPQVAGEISESLTLMSDAVRDVKSSKKFRKLLEYVLAIGNYINGQGKRGGVWGFKLDTLEKLDRHRSTDGKTSLLMYLVMLLTKQDPDLLDLASDFASLEKARTIAFLDLQNQSKQLKSGLKMIEGMLKDPPANNKDKFSKIFTPFVEDGNKQYEKQEKEIQDINTKLEKIINGYGEEASKMQSSEFFTILINFAKSLKDTKLAIEKRAEEDAKNAKREEERAKKALVLAQKKAAGGVGMGDVASVVLDDNKGVFDQFKSSLAGNSDDVVNRLKMRHAAGKEAGGSGGVASELAAKLAAKRDKK